MPRSTTYKRLVLCRKIKLGRVVVHHPMGSAESTAIPDRWYGLDLTLQGGPLTSLDAKLEHVAREVDAVRKVLDCWVSNLAPLVVTS